jgi:hypothetical protein
MTQMRRCGGQSSIEQTILIVMVAAALVSMFAYIRSAVSHRMKSGADGIGQGLQY